MIKSIALFQACHLSWKDIPVRGPVVLVVGA